MTTEGQAAAVIGASGSGLDWIGECVGEAQLVESTNGTNLGEVGRSFMSPVIT